MQSQCLSAPETSSIADHTTLGAIPRVDTLFVNAGDPGGQNPDDLV